MKNQVEKSIKWKPAKFIKCFHQCLTGQLHSGRAKLQKCCFPMNCVVFPLGFLFLGSWIDTFARFSLYFVRFLEALTGIFTSKHIVPPMHIVDTPSRASVHGAMVPTGWENTHILKGLHPTHVFEGTEIEAILSLIWKTQNTTTCRKIWKYDKIKTWNFGFCDFGMCIFLVIPNL